MHTLKLHWNLCILYRTIFGGVQYILQEGLCFSPDNLLAVLCWAQLSYHTQFVVIEYCLTVQYIPWDTFIPNKAESKIIGTGKILNKARTFYYKGLLNWALDISLWLLSFKDYLEYTQFRVYMNLLIAEERSNSKWNPIESIIQSPIPLFWASFPINCRSSNWCPRNLILISWFDRGCLLQGNP